MWLEVVVKGTKQGAKPFARNLALIIVTANGAGFKKD
jgi:hypothetical protein